MAKLKKGEKTKAARDYLAAHPAASPKEIVAGLAASGMKIKLGLANSIKYSRRGKKARRRCRAHTMLAAARRSSNGAVTVEQLIEVKKLADSIGGAEQVRAVLDALEQLR